MPSRIFKDHTKPYLGLTFHCMWFTSHKTQNCQTVVNPLVNSDYFMVVTFKIVHVVRLDNQKSVTMTTPDPMTTIWLSELSLKVVIATT